MNEHKNAGQTAEERRLRIRRIKRALVVIVVAALLLPTLMCIYLLIRMNDLEEQLRTLYETRSESRYLAGEDRLSEASISLRQAKTIWPEEEESSPDGGHSDEPEDGTQTVYLTFDDGPSVYTDEILDILKEYGVKATFFVVGTSDPDRLEDYRRIVREGHTIGIHSYSHQYGKVYASVESFSQDVEQLRDLIYETTGVYTPYYRFPGGSSNRVSSVDMEELIRLLDDSGIRYFDWNVSAGDATSQAVNRETAVRNTFSNAGLYDEAMVLLHDTGDKRTTVEALPEIIETFREMGAVFQAVDGETKPIQHISLEEIK